jgi:hypothetical protein
MPLFFNSLLTLSYPNAGFSVLSKDFNVLSLMVRCFIPKNNCDFIIFHLNLHALKKHCTCGNAGAMLHNYELV